MPDTVFKAVVKVPYDTDVPQVGAMAIAPPSTWALW